MPRPRSGTQGLRVDLWEAWGTNGAGTEWFLSPSLLPTPTAFGHQTFIGCTQWTRLQRYTALTGPEFPKCFLILWKLWVRLKLVFPQAQHKLMALVNSPGRWEDAVARLAGSMLISTKLFKKHIIWKPHMFVFLIKNESGKIQKTIKMPTIMPVSEINMLHKKTLCYINWLLLFRELSDMYRLVAGCLQNWNHTEYTTVYPDYFFLSLHHEHIRGSWNIL